MAHGNTGDWKTMIESKRSYVRIAWRHLARVNVFALCLMMLSVSMSLE